MLVHIIVVLLVAGAFCWIVSMLPAISALFKSIIYVVVVIAVAVWLLPIVASLAHLP